jgi:hypothetical protein
LRFLKKNSWDIYRNISISDDDYIFGLRKIQVIWLKLRMIIIPINYIAGIEYIRAIFCLIFPSSKPMGLIISLCSECVYNSTVISLQLIKKILINLLIAMVAKARVIADGWKSCLWFFDWDMIGSYSIAN